MGAETKGTVQNPRQRHLSHGYTPGFGGLLDRVDDGLVEGQAMAQREKLKILVTP